MACSKFSRKQRIAIGAAFGAGVGVFWFWMMRVNFLNGFMGSEMKTFVGEIKNRPWVFVRDVAVPTVVASAANGYLQESCPR